MLTRPLVRVLAAGLAVFVVALVWFILQVYPLGGPGKEVIVTVHAGDSLSVIAGEMHAKGVISSTIAFRIDTVLFGAPTIQAGSYQIAQNSSFAKVKSVFGSAPNVRVIDVVPGLTLNEVALQVASQVGNTFANTFVQDATSLATRSPFHPNRSLEGLIGTGSYIVTPGETPLQLIQKMVAAFADQTSSVGLTPATTSEGLNAYQLVIAASIVEREGYYAVNMPRVARVVFNRLARGQALQMDSTVKYYFHMDAGTVTSKMLEAQTPYNTYLHAGLTPTPICVVSTTAMKAVLNPPQGTWLYFVLVDKNGTMAFSTTFAQQLANEKLAASRGL